MSILESEKSEILGNMSSPDAPKPPVPQTMPKKRGRPPINGAASPKGNKPQGITGKPATEEETMQGAIAINTMVFTMAYVVTGAEDAFPEKEKAAAMDKALQRYMMMKGFTVPPEVALFAAYGIWVKELAGKDSVKKSLNARFGGIGGKVKNFFSKFKKKQ